MKQLTRRAIVFVAYDLGALIVKNVCITNLHPGESRLVLTELFQGYFNCWAGPVSMARDL